MSKCDVWICRVMDEATYRLVSNISPSNLDVFEISGNEWHDIFKWKSFTTSDFPAFDVCHHAFDKQYDLIIAEQVFEHLRYPAKAAKIFLTGFVPAAPL